MSESKGILLSVSSHGQLVTPTIRKENGDIVMAAVNWEDALKRMIILSKVNKTYLKKLEERHVGSR